MLKKIYIKNGIIIVSNITNMKINYILINSKNKDVNKAKKEYYNNIGITY